ncbi:2-amino-4-hydroxy-6-hydroxymethyldihydropteridine diphosphokinase [uncultured Draconibacterium sp.]|uniref:2-amino-4-hydroxy-6- hydroxymethyldihydropteridine diphosphokinase n=1 Tax=uncultured Draconibacterium sp. TaxID=1573823 RepID=UPI0032178B53
MDLQAGNFYHIYNRGNNSQKIFFKDENYMFFLEKMKKHLSPFVSVIAWCLMPNHFHWVVFVHRENENSDTLTQSESITRLRTINQSIGILLRSYTRAIQKQENSTGSLFQTHTKAKLLIDEIEISPAYWNTAFGTQINNLEGNGYLETCVKYVHENPVYSGLVKNAENWEYSSCRDYKGLRNGKLIDYKMILAEGLLNPDGNKIDSLTQSETLNVVIIGIGSNINAETNIAHMFEILKTRVEVLQVSCMVKTKPIGIEDQADFTNGAVKIRTELTIEKLTVLLKSIEDQMGRNRKAPKFGPRCIDLDIAVWNGKIVDKDYYTRDFLRNSVQELSDE